MKSTVTKSALVLTSFLLWQATTVVAEDATSTKTSSEVSTTTDITTSSTTTASSETTASETTTSKTTSSSETIPENTTDPYFPKQPISIEYCSRLPLRELNPVEKQSIMIWGTGAHINIKAYIG